MPLLPSVVPVPRSLPSASVLLQLYAAALVAATTPALALQLPQFLPTQETVAAAATSVQPVYCSFRAVAAAAAAAAASVQPVYCASRAAAAATSVQPVYCASRAAAATAAAAAATMV